MSPSEDLYKHGQPTARWFASIRLRYGADVYQRCAVFYEQLLALPRRARRRLTRRMRMGLAGAALFLALAGNPVPAAAATITVDGTTCTLAQAITTANDGSVQGSCTLGDAAGPDLIMLGADVNLASAGLPDISSSVTIDGASAPANRTINGGGGSIFTVQADGDLTLRNAIVTNGSATLGGAIYNNGGVATVSGSTLSSNSATYGGAIWNQFPGTLVMSNSTLSGNSSNGGGAIANNSAMTVTRSTLSSNSAQVGGAIFTGLGTVTVSDSTLSGNYGLSGGGAIYNVLDGTVIVSNSTLSGNWTGSSGLGGAIYNEAFLTVRNSTLTGNSAGTGGGIYVRWEVTLERSIVSGNQAIWDGPEMYLDVGNIDGDADNVIGYGGDARCGYNWTPGASDVVPVGPLSSVLDSLLSDNGGPTQTHALVAGSPAIDIAVTGPTTDQRGYARPVGAGYDAGAFEHGSGAPTAVGLSFLTAGQRPEPASTSAAGALAGLFVALSGLTAWVRRRR